MDIEICVKKIHRTPVKKNIYVYIFGGKFSDNFIYYLHVFTLHLEKGR